MEPIEPQPKFKKSVLTEATPFSKYLAMTLFICMPFIGGWVGYQYAPEQVVEVKTIILATEGPRELTDQPKNNFYEDIPAKQKFSISEFEGLDSLCPTVRYSTEEGVLQEVEPVAFMLGRERRERELVRNHERSLCTLYDDSYVFDGTRVMVAYGIYNPLFKIIDFADWETLEVLEWPYAKDKNNTYYYDQVVEDQ